MKESERKRINGSSARRMASEAASMTAKKRKHQRSDKAAKKRHGINGEKQHQA